MRKVLGVLMVLAGVVLGLWAGVWWAFIGGIVDVITQIRAEHLSPLAVGIGFAKIFFASLIGWVACFVLAMPGMVLMGKE